MGRSNSCFKIIACGSDSTDRDDLQAPESKGSTDKRGWSFRKRSARHRVLSNTVISETPSSIIKNSPDSTALNFQPSNVSTVPEKITVVQCADEKPELPTQVDSLNSKASETIATITAENEVEFKLEESMIIAIQAAIRRFLAEKELAKIKNVVKLQAAVRGHLVRRHAVGSLRCVQAIVKMQALVRARLSRQEAHAQKEEKENPVSKPNETYTSIQKLLSNRFARQLMESTPRTKPIHIKCDPSKPNSAWMWLERWMAVSPSEETQDLELNSAQPETETGEKCAFQVENRVEELLESANLKSSDRETVLPSGKVDNRSACDADHHSKFSAPGPSSSIKEELKHPSAEIVGATDAEETLVQSILLPSHSIESQQADSPFEPNSVTVNPDLENEQPKRSMKRVASEQLETEGKKFVFGSRKASNPSFIAAQSKFEELSTTPQSNSDAVSSGSETVTKTMELNKSENVILQNLKVEYGGSECGTELSITSTLDSPDRFEVGATEFYHGVKASGEEICFRNDSKENFDEANDSVNLSDSVQDQHDKLDDAKVESEKSVIIADSPQVEQKQDKSTSDLPEAEQKPDKLASDLHEAEQKPERSASDLHKEHDTETARHEYSPEASPRSHITVPESQGTPSSQVSVKPRKNRTEKSRSNQKRKSLSASRGSPSNPNHDSGARNSTEQLPRDQKSGKRRNSFGSTGPDNMDQEPRDSSSSSSLPHFMQATESARAKVQANNSPRSSPDVHEKDIYIKKRHSLPGSNGRQGSPRVQRSTSQAQQSAKGNAAFPHGSAPLLSKWTPHPLNKKNGRGETSQQRSINPSADGKFGDRVLV